MAREVRYYAVSVPASTTIAAPLVTPLAMDIREVRSIRWMLAPGCAGLVGFYISMGKVQVQPLPQGSWVIGDGESGEWTLHEQPDSGAWQVTAYNTGSHSHLIRLWFHVDIVRGRKHHVELIDNIILSNYSTQRG